MPKRGRSGAQLSGAQLSDRQRMIAAVEASLASARPPPRRLPMEDRKRAPTPAVPTSVDRGDGVERRVLRLAEDAARLQFDRTIQQGTIVDCDGQRLAGALYDPHTGLTIDSSELHVHPDPVAVNNRSEQLRMSVLTTPNVDVDLGAPLVGPPASPTQAGAWTIEAADGAAMATVLYVPTCAAAGPGVRVGDLAESAVRAVAEAMEEKYTSDEKTGGGYIVAGNGCMSKDPPPPQIETRDGKRHNVPYSRVCSDNAVVSRAVGAVAPLMGACAQCIGREAPSCTSDLAATVREHPVVADTFMYPPHAWQRRGIGDDASSHGSIAAHQIALRLAGRRLALPRTASTATTARRARYAPCALHLDTDDAPRLHGAPLLYALRVEAGARLPDGARARPMPEQDLVIFERRDGGRAVRIQTACVSHVCVVIFRSDAQLHANVFPDTLEIEPTMGVQLLRVVPYSRRGIDAFCRAVEIEPDLWAGAAAQLDEGLRRRASGEEAAAGDDEMFDGAASQVAASDAEGAVDDPGVAEILAHHVYGGARSGSLYNVYVRVRYADGSTSGRGGFVPSAPLAGSDALAAYLRTERGRRIAKYAPNAGRPETSVRHGHL